MRTPIRAAVLLLLLALSAAAWTDHPPVVRQTRVRALHLIEIGQAVNARLVACGMAPAPVPAPGAFIRAADFNATRACVNAFYAGFAKPAPSFTGGPLLPVGATVRLVHLIELRAAVDASGAWACCVPDGSCSAKPACEKTASGTDNCGNACSRTGPKCPPRCGDGKCEGGENCRNCNSLYGGDCAPPFPCEDEGTVVKISACGGGDTYRGSTPCCSCDTSCYVSDDPSTSYANTGIDCRGSNCTSGRSTVHFCAH